MTPHARTRWLAGASGALVLSAGTLAQAEPLGSVAVAGTCPAQELVQAALARRTLPPSAGGYALVVRASTGGADVTLALLDGTPRSARHLGSSDCAALAEAAALIVETYFVELAAADSARGELEPSAEPTPPAIAPATTPAAGPVTSEPRSPGQQRTSPAPPAATVTAPPPGRAALFELGGGVDALFERAAWATVVRAGGGIFWARPKLELELTAALAGVAHLGSAPDEVRRAETRAGVRAARRLGTARALAPWLGAGVSRSELTLLGLDAAPTRVRWSPLFEAGLLANLPVLATWSLRVDASCRLYLVRERYEVQPEGSIGNGPRVACGLTTGLAWHTAPSR